MSPELSTQLKGNFHLFSYNRFEDLISNKFIELYLIINTLQQK